MGAPGWQPPSPYSKGCPDVREVILSGATPQPANKLPERLSRFASGASWTATPPNSHADAGGPSGSN